MGTNFDLFDFAELIQKRPGSGIDFSLCDGGVVYHIDRSRNFGIIVGIPDGVQSAITIPDYEDMEVWELAISLDPFFLSTSRQNNERYDRNSIKVFSLTI